MEKYLLFISSIFIFISGFSTNYYVSSSLGDDSNNGQTIGTPWKTLQKVRLENFLPGDTIFFKRNDIWKEDRELFIDEEGTAVSPIVFTDYGSGDLPTINVESTLPNNLPWVNEGGNIWKITLDSATVIDYNIPYLDNLSCFKKA